MENQNLLIGQGIGVATGAAVGAGIGIKKASTLLKPYAKIAPQGTDAFFKNQVSYVAEELKTAKAKGLINKGDFQGYKVVKQSIIDKYNALSKKLPSVVEKAKSTKIKWIAGLAAAGLAIGTAATLIYNKVKADKN